MFASWHLKNTSFLSDSIHVIRMLLGCGALGNPLYYGLCSWSHLKNLWDIFMHLKNLNSFHLHIFPKTSYLKIPTREEPLFVSLFLFCTWYNILSHIVNKCILNASLLYFFLFQYMELVWRWTLLCFIYGTPIDFSLLWTKWNLCKIQPFHASATMWSEMCNERYIFIHV